jgi:L-2,4-diaminobutyrate decarboxylase
MKPPQSERSASLDAIRTRVGKAWDADLFRASGMRVIDSLAAHLAGVQEGEGPVLNWKEPKSNIAAATDALHSVVNPVADRVSELANEILSRGQNLNHPHYIGHQVPAPSPLAGLFDAIGAVTNQVMGIYEMGPFTTAVERAVVDELGQLIGWESDSFSGVVTHGGSLANLTAMLTARNVQLQSSWSQGHDPATQPCIVANADAHYCINRAAGIMGMGTESIVSAELNSVRSIDVAALDRLVTGLIDEGRTIIAVAASSCSTPTGAFDDLNGIADVCEKHGLWMHVDAAHGGGALFSRTHRRRLAGIERADSVVWDAHKMLFVPALCAFVFFRNRSHGFSAFQQNAPYLFDDEQPGINEYDSALRTLECTKRAASLGIWGLWSVFGTELFSDLIDLTFGLTARFYEMLDAAVDFEVPYEPEANILVFRWNPESRDLSNAALNILQAAVRRKLVRSGEFYIVQTEINGIVWLRVTVMNPLTTEDHLRALLEAVRELSIAQLPIAPMPESNH